MAQVFLFIHARTLYNMKLIRLEDYQIKVADEALLVRPIRKLFHQDRSQGKEQFYKQMSVLFFMYSPASNYSYILDEKDRIKEILAQEGITDWKPSADFKAAVEVYKKLVKTTSSELLEDTREIIEKLREALKTINFDALEAKDMPNAVKTVATTIGMFPKLIKDLSEAEKAVAREMEEQSSARGSQELSIFDTDVEQLREVLMAFDIIHA